LNAPRIAPSLCPNEGKCGAGIDLSEGGLLITPPSTELTRFLVDWSNGSHEALARLMPLVYDELRLLASRHLRHERSDHTLQTTALVHEAYLRLIDQHRVSWQNRAHFFGIAAQMMRRILVDHARAQQADKRGGGAPKLSLDEAVAFAHEREVDFIALDRALTKLAALDPQQSRIVELRFFGGLTVEEVAEVLSISPATIKRDWSMAKAWLLLQINGQVSGTPANEQT
jgi:RNA polymerase sigma factor (TIGR02999 family)